MIITTKKNNYTDFHNDLLLYYLREDLNRFFKSVLEKPFK